MTPWLQRSGTPLSLLGEFALTTIVGVSALPYLFGDAAALAAYASAPVRAALWTVLALLLAGWLLLVSRTIARRLADVVSALPRRGSEVGSPPEIVAILLVALADVVALNAILRPPVSALLALRTAPETAEAALGGGAALLVLALLFRLHFVARPYVEGSVWSALDVVVATTSSAEFAETAFAPTMTALGPTVTPRTTPDVSDLPTLAATRPDHDAMTRVDDRPAADDSTRVVPRRAAEPDAADLTETRPAPRDEG